MGRMLDGSLTRLLWVVEDGWWRHADHLRSIALMPGERCPGFCLLCAVEDWTVPALFALAWSEWRGRELHVPRWLRSWAWGRLAMGES